ncbi:recombinase family protein [Streptomyces sp. NPDC059835]|uniref:recombinase family protein n=1 Tax=Streptomyces sp. NPDC059835 TaxID=3346967 RepID=UPI003659BE8C
MLAPYLAAGAPIYEAPATSTRIVFTNRAGFRWLLDGAAVGDTIRLADAARLFRSLSDILALCPFLIRRGLHLRTEDGLLSGIDLAADDKGTTFIVGMLGAVLEFQRDMISDNTKEGMAAARTRNKTIGRAQALTAEQQADAVEAHRNGAAVKALARDYKTSPQTIRRVLDAAGARAVPVSLDPADALP